MPPEQHSLRSRALEAAVTIHAAAATVLGVKAVELAQSDEPLLPTTENMTPAAGIMAAGAVALASICARGARTIYRRNQQS